MKKPNINVSSIKKEVMDFRVKRSIGIAFRNKLGYGSFNCNILFNALLVVLQSHPEIIHEIKEYQKLND